MLREATASDYDRVAALLVANGLPLDGVPPSLAGFVVAIADGGELAGVAGIENCGPHGLLRSAAVDASYRGLGVGARLVTKVIEDATNRGTQSLYLLTTTAEDYFPAFGFEVVIRTDVPDEIRATGEFTTACPASATVMRRRPRQ